MIISELNLYYDKNRSDDETHYKKGTDNYAIIVLDYIKKHFDDKDISFKKINEKYFISLKTLDTICHRFVGFSFWQSITLLRMEKANMLIKQSDAKLIKIAEMCGYSVYSVFYRAYKKHFGTSPGKHRQHNRDYRPLT